MTVDLSVEIEESDVATLSLIAAAGGRTIEAYVTGLVHTEAVRLRQAEAFSRLADRRLAVQDTWFSSVVADDEQDGRGTGSAEDQVDD